MASSEKRKHKSAGVQSRDPLTTLTEQQLHAMQQGAKQPPKAYLSGTSFGASDSALQPLDSGFSPLNSVPAELDSDNVFVFYPAEGSSPEAARPTLVDAVLEQLRQARLRRSRPH